MVGEDEEIEASGQGGVLLEGEATVLGDGDGVDEEVGGSNDTDEAAET